MMAGKCRRELMLKVIGYRPHESVLDVEDYRDFPIDRELSITEVRTGLDQGIFPPGLLIRVTTGGPLGVVSGIYGVNEFVEVVV